MEIIKKVPDLKHLIQFRSVSKEWKSFIDSPHFIAFFGFRVTQPHRLILNCMDEYLCFLDDNHTFTQQQDSPPIVSDLIKQFQQFSIVVGSSCGSWCLEGNISGRNMLVLWNPSIRRSVAIVVPYDFSYPYKTTTFFGFGVCPVTNDPTIVKISYIDIFSKMINSDNMHWNVEIFTLSSKRWEMIPNSNLPRESIRLRSSQVVIDRFIYWVAYDIIVADDGESRKEYMIVSFDLITKEFKVVDVPDSITNRFLFGFSISKLRESLIVFGYVRDDEMFTDDYCGVWMMVRDGGITSFRGIFVFDTPVSWVTEILGFRENGEPIIVAQKEDEQFPTLEVYEPHSRHITNLGIFGADDLFFMSSCTESMLLLDHPDCSTY
ncbi:F-box protein-like protein [Tanacetum coccineum]